MVENYGIRKHLAGLESAGKPEAVEERRVSNEANKKAMEETRKEYPIITVDNFEEADSYRIKRFAFWKLFLDEERLS